MPKLHVCLGFKSRLGWIFFCIQLASWGICVDCDSLLCKPSLSCRSLVGGNIYHAVIHTYLNMIRQYVWICTLVILHWMSLRPLLTSRAQHWVVWRPYGMEIFAEAFPSNFKASWAVSVASLGVREPFLGPSRVVISGATASNRRVCILAKLLTVSLAGFGSLDV